VLGIWCSFSYWARGIPTLGSPALWSHHTSSNSKCRCAQSHREHSPPIFKSITCLICAAPKFSLVSSRSSGVIFELFDCRRPHHQGCHQPRSRGHARRPQTHSAITSITLSKNLVCLSSCLLSRLRDDVTARSNSPTWCASQCLHCPPGAVTAFANTSGCSGCCRHLSLLLRITHVKHLIAAYHCHSPLGSSRSQCSTSR